MPKFERRPADRPVEILAAALNCFAERGFAATTMAEIAASAGVTAGTIYRYFPSKEALVEALVESGRDASWNRGREVAEAYRSRTAREVVALLLERWAAHLEADQAAALLRVMAREGAGFPETTTKYGAQLLDSGRLAIERALRHGIERGEFPVLAVEEYARAMAMAVLGAVTWRTAFGAGLRGSPDPVRQTIAAVVRGIPGLRNSPPAAATATQPMPPAGSRVVESATTAGGLRIVTLGPPTHESNR